MDVKGRGVKTRQPDAHICDPALTSGEPLHTDLTYVKAPKQFQPLTDRDTAREVGGSVVKRTDESLGKITDVIKYDVVDPTVTSRYSLADVAQAIAEVEGGHTAGKVIVVP